MSDEVKAKDHESYGSFSLIAVILPLVGLILGIVYLTKDKRIDRKLGEHLVAFSVLFMLIWGTLASVYVMKQQSNAQTNAVNAYQQALQQ